MHDPHQLKLMERATSLGIEVEDLSTKWGMDIVAYRKGGREAHVIKGRIYPNLSLRASMIADHKIACKQLMTNLNIPTAKALLLEDREDDAKAIEAFLRANKPVVCKPVGGTNGQGVKLGITTLDALNAHMSSLSGPLMLETEASGYDLRLQAVGGALVAACIRIPTTLVGDGVSSVEQLIELRNRQIALQNPLNYVDIDHETMDLLKELGLALDSVLEKGRQVRIKQAANMAQGAQAVDVTDEVHPDYLQSVSQISAALGMTIFAMDFVVNNHRKSLKGHGVALEVNARPAWMHHTISEVRTHDMPGLILKELLQL